VNIEAIEGAVHGAEAIAKSNFRFSRAKASRKGVVSRSYPYALTWSARSVSIAIRMTSGRLGSAAASASATAIATIANGTRRSARRRGGALIRPNIRRPPFPRERRR